MNRYLILGGVVLCAFLLGIFRVSSMDHAPPEMGAGWQGTAMPARSDLDVALRQLASSSRWEVEVADNKPSGEPGSFSEEYRLVGVVDSDALYALLVSTASKDKQSHAIQKVVVGDRLPNDWVVTEIKRAAVVATKEEESQSVELFPAQ